MQKQTVFFGLAGVFFGLLTGWIIGSQQATPGMAGVPAPQATQARGAQAQAQPPAPLDESRAAALKVTADRNPSDAQTRIELGNLYFDAERYSDAAQWYQAALKINPKEVNASTDLGIVYYYLNQPDRALSQFEQSLAIDPRHSKTLLNIGIVRAFGKEDLEGATKAWEKLIEVAPNSPEAEVAKKGLEGMRSGHSSMPGGAPAKTPGSPDR